MQPFGYAGGLTDSQTGLIRFGARDYDPVAGRWTAKDPIGFAGGASSLYEYAANNPVFYVDPTGRAAETILDVVAVGLSLRDFFCKPSWANAGWVALDVAGALVPFMPSVGVFRHSYRGAKVTLKTTAELPNALRGGEATTDVYLGVRDGKEVYVGITNNLQRRQAQHADRFDLAGITGSPLTRGEARAVEQALIVRNPGFDNVRNSISPRHAWYGDAVAWGEAWLRANGR